MTKFGAEVKFSSECLIKFSRLPVAYNGNCFFINTGRNSVSSIQEQDQKLLQTWTLMHPHSFTTPVIFCSVNNTVSCIMDCNFLLTWSPSDEDLSCVSKIKLNDPVFAILPVANSCIFIIFANGAALRIEQVTPNTKTATSEVLDPDEELIWSDALLLINDVLLAYVTRNKKTREYNLHSSVMKDGEDHITSLHSQPISREEFSLKCWCLSSGTDSPSLLTLWNDGKVCAFFLNEPTSKCLFSVANINNESYTAIDSIGASHLAVAKQSLLANEKEAVLEIWDLKYSVRKAVKTLKYNLLKIVQIKTFHSTIFLSSSEGIIAVPIQLEKSTLSSVLGKSISSSTNDSVKSYTWTSEGDVMVETPSSDNEAKTTYPLLSTNLTSKMFGEVVGNLPAEEITSFVSIFSELKDISEEELVKMLQMCLVMTDQLNNEEMMEEENVTCQRILLNGVFKIPFSDIFLIQHLKCLSFNETVMALRFLLKLFKSELFSGRNSHAPSDLQIINWIELLMQSHYDELVISKDKKIIKLLRKLQHTLLQKMDVYTELGEIEELLKLLKRRNILPEKTVNSRYCTETMFS